MSLKPHEILLRPVLTEKVALLAEENANRLVFRVAKTATKPQIREAITATFGVKVAKINTMRMPGKPKRFGRYQGRRPGYKKAIITLVDGENVDLFALDGVGEDNGEV